MNLCYTLCPNQIGHSLSHGGFCPEDKQLQNCSSYSLMKKIDAVLVESSSFLFGVFGTFVNNVCIFCPNKPGLLILILRDGYKHHCFTLPRDFLLTWVSTALYSPWHDVWYYE